MDSFTLDTLGNKFISKTGDVDSKAFQNILFIGIYFSAHWCPSCKAFTPILADFYKNANKDKKEIEIIYSSMDNDDDQFKEYYDAMPWLAIPFGDAVIEKLVDTFNIQGIPALIVFDKNGQLVDKAARHTVQNNNLASLDLWKEKIKSPSH